MRVCFCPLTRNPAMKSRAYLSLMAGLSRARLRYREAPRRRPSSVAWRRTMEMAHGYHRSRRQPIRRSKEASHPHPAIQAETSCHTGPAAWAPVLAAPSRHVPSRQVHGPEQEDAPVAFGRARVDQRVCLHFRSRHGTLASVETEQVCHLAGDVFHARVAPGVQGTSLSAAQLHVSRQSNGPPAPNSAMLRCAVGSQAWLGRHPHRPATWHTNPKPHSPDRGPWTCVSSREILRGQSKTAPSATNAPYCLTSKGTGPHEQESTTYGTLSQHLSPRCIMATLWQGSLR